MSDFPGSANTYNFGTDFNYSLWTPGTEISLVNVPWNNDYRDVVRFENQMHSQTLDEYIDSKESTGIVIQHLSYVKPNEPIRVDIPHTRAQKFNYLRASNPLQPIPTDQQKNYYYFILDVRYIAPNTTELVLQLDIFQTYIYSAEFGNCYIERGHIGIANENAFNSFGRDYLTIPEGLDVGGEYQTVATKNKWIMTSDSGANPPEEYEWRYPGCDVLVISAVDLTASGGTVANPELKTAKGTMFQGTTQGAGVYIFSQAQFMSFLVTHTTKPWVTQGITSVTLIPKMTRYHPGFDYSSESDMGVAATTFYPITRVNQLWNAWRNSSIFQDRLGSRYDHLKKFYTYPYMAIEMTTFNATPVVIKPESWNTANAQIFERAALLPPGQRIEFSPRFYNAVNNDADALPDLYPWYNELSYTNGVYEDVKGDDGGDYIDMITQIANFPTMSIVNSGQLGYLASNVHGIAFQHQSADWSQSRAMGSAQAQYDIASQAMHTAMSLAGIGMNADIAQTANVNRTQAMQGAVNAANSAINGIGNALTPGGFGGAAIGGISAGIATGINTAVGIASNDEALAIRQQQAGSSVIAQNQNAGFARDTNQDLANWAAKGDYANTISAINAKVQDAALIQPTTSGQVGGETMNLINGGWQISLRWKMIDKAAIRIIGDYWLRYGYAIRAFIKPPKSLTVMEKFTYWKMSETYLINTGIPESHKQSIRGIFEKGVTVWTSPWYIGTIDIADNTPLGGISY